MAATTPRAEHYPPPSANDDDPRDNHNRQIYLHQHHGKSERRREHFHGHSLLHRCSDQNHLTPNLSVNQPQSRTKTPYLSHVPLPDTSWFGLIKTFPFVSALYNFSSRDQDCAHTSIPTSLSSSTHRVPSVVRVLSSPPNNVPLRHHDRPRSLERPGTYPDQHHTDITSIRTYIRSPAPKSPHPSAPQP